MPCYSPLRAWRGDPLPSGKRSIVFKRKESVLPTPLNLPCNQCTGCRLEYSRQWAMRCMDEASLSPHNCFLTLTYNEEKLPVGGSLQKRDFQLFMKKLRKKFGEGIRYYHCGEYGETFRRPHYHACIFGFDFSDRVFHHSNFNGDRLYTSATLDSIWNNGFALIGDVTFESAAYVARYVMKKITGKDADDHYLNKETGELMQPEYVTMSRGSKKLGTGGIGKGWYQKYKRDLFPSDTRIVRGKKMQPARYYGSLFEIEDPDAFASIKDRRKKKALTRSEDNTLWRLYAREKVKIAQIKNLTRNVE